MTRIIFNLRNMVLIRTNKITIVREKIFEYENRSKESSFEFFDFQS